MTTVEQRNMAKRLYQVWARNMLVSTGWDDLPGDVKQAWERVANSAIYRAAQATVEASSTPQALDVDRVARIFEGPIGDRLYFLGAAYGYLEGESYDKIAADVAAEYARLASEPTETGETDG